MEINGLDITDDLAGPTQLQKNWLNHLYIFCLHAVHSGSLEMAGVSNDIIAELRQQLIIPMSVVLWANTVLSPTMSQSSLDEWNRPHKSMVIECPLS